MSTCCSLQAERQDRFESRSGASYALMPIGMMTQNKIEIYGQSAQRDSCRDWWAWLGDDVIWDKTLPRPCKSVVWTALSWLGRYKTLSRIRICLRKLTRPMGQYVDPQSNGNNGNPLEPISSRVDMWWWWWWPYIGHINLEPTNKHLCVVR